MLKKDSLLSKMIKHFSKWMDIRRKVQTSNGGKILGAIAEEAALLQSFPVGFVFTGKSDDIYRQIGEAVPPMLSSAIAVNVLIELLSICPTQEEIDFAPKAITEPVSSSYSSVIAGIKTRGRVAK